MQINHNISAMVTQHALYQNNNALGKSLEKLSTGLRINRAQDDAAGLAMSEQMRSQIRGLGKAKQNAQDGICALQIAEGALAEITNMMQRQKELAVQAANDTLTSTERIYLDDEFQALTKEMDRIAKTTDYNGKNVLIFDQNPNLSFGATKLNPYNREVSFLESSKTLYDAFGSKLSNGLQMVGGDSITTTTIAAARNALGIAQNNLSFYQKIYDGVSKELLEKEYSLIAAESAERIAQAAQNVAEIERDLYVDLNHGGTPPAAGADSAYDALASKVLDIIAEIGVIGGQITVINTQIGVLTPAAANALTDLNAAKADVSAARSDLNAAEAPAKAQVARINDAITAVNQVISNLNGVELNDMNIKQILEDILGAGDIATNFIPLGANDPQPTYGGDAVFANVLFAFDITDPDLAGFQISGADEQAVKDFNLFLREARDAYDAFCASETGNPKYGSNDDVLAAAIESMAYALGKVFNSDNSDIVSMVTYSGQVRPEINSMIGGGNYSTLSKAMNNITMRLNSLISIGGFNPSTGVLTTSGVGDISGIFGYGASQELKDAVATVMQFNIDKMADSNGIPLDWDHPDKQRAVVLQKAIGELQEHFGHYSNEAACPVGTAASEILHITPNYSNSLGGRESSEINVNYVEINIKGLGLHAQSITEQANATRSIDRIDDVLKVISGNRAAIGTYINRLEYTINNIASMTYNTQEAESRIRDTDFSKETTDFTRNQIMVQSATSILAQANNIPQMVLGLLG